MKINNTIVRIGEYKKKSKVELIITLIIIFVFCIPSEIRLGILGRKLGMVNYIATGLILYLTAINIKNINKKYILYVYFLLFYYVLTSSFYEKKLSNLLIAILSYIVPLLLIGLKVEERILKSLFRRILKILNFIMILVTCLGLIESMLGIDIYIYI